MSDFGTFIDSITQDRIVPKVADNVLNENLLFGILMKNKRPAGGAEIKLPIKYTTNGAGATYSGFETLSTNQANTRVYATVTPKQTAWPVAVSGIQIAVNKGPEKVLDLLATEMDSVAADMADNIGTQIYSDGTGNSSKYITGLDAMVDDGNGTGTYLGLARSTYTTWVSNIDSSSNSITIAEIAASYEAASIGAEEPTLGVTTPSIFATIEGLLNATLNWNNPGGSVMAGTAGGNITKGRSADIGVSALYYKGKPIISDYKCTSTRFYWLNTKHIWVYVWPSPDFPGYVSKPNYNGFIWTGLKLPTNQDASVGHFLFYANLATDACRLHSYMTTKT